MMSFAADAVVYACHSREGRNSWVLAFARHSSERRNQLLALSSSQRKLGSILLLLLLVIPAKAGIQRLCFWLLSLNVKSVSSATRPSSFLLISVKRNEPKKNAFPDEAAPGLHCYQDFSTRHPGSVEKRRTSLCAALRVSSCCCGFGILRSEKRWLSPFCFGEIGKPLPAR